MIRLVFLLVALAVSSGALAQSRTGASVPTVAAEVEKIAEAARRDGMTVVVIAPPTAAPPAAMMDTMRAERFLAARARLSSILASVATLPDAMVLTLQRINALGRLAGDPFSFWWLLQGLGTALVGGFAGWLALRPVVRMSGRAARRNLEARFTIRTTADRAWLLLRKTLLALLFAISIYAIGLLVGVLLDSGFEPTRRVIFEALTAFLIYRLLRFGFAWPVTSYDFTEHRLVGLDDRQARRLYRSFVLWVAATLVPLALARFFVAEGLAAEHGGEGLRRAHARPRRASDDRVGRDRHDRRRPLRLPQPARGASAFRAARRARCGEGQGRLASRARRVRGGEPLSDRPSTACSRFSPSSSGSDWANPHRRRPSWRPSRSATSPSSFTVWRWSRSNPSTTCASADTAPGSSRNASGRFWQRKRTARGLPRAKRCSCVRRSKTGWTRWSNIARSCAASSNRGALVLVLVVAAGELGRWWGVPVGEDGNAWAGFLDIVLAVALAVIAYRAITAAIDKRLDEEGGPAEDEDAVGNEGGAGASRLATLLPILRWVLVAVVVVAAVIAILSRFGVDIGPLLASAGVIGIAVGFGAQKLIQDVFSGAFFLLDDAFRRGEYIEVEGTKGTVERISIRSFQLRHHLGALHTLPFGEIRQLTNYSRDWVLMKLPLRVTYDTDVEKVRKLIKKLGRQLLEHPEVGHTFMQPLKSQGVYKMEDSAMIIRVKFMTKPGEQFVTRKVVYAAIQELFAREGIRFAHKEVTVRLAEGEGENLSGEQRKAVTAAAREVIDAEEAAELEGSVRG